MRGLMRFGEWERLLLCGALPLTRIASRSDLSPHLRGEVKQKRLASIVACSNTGTAPNSGAVFICTANAAGRPLNNGACLGQAFLTIIPPSKL